MINNDSDSHQNPIYLLCLILFDIKILFLASSHIKVEQFFGSYNRLQKTAWLGKFFLRYLT